MPSKQHCEKWSHHEDTIRLDSHWYDSEAIFVHIHTLFSGVLHESMYVYIYMYTVATDPASCAFSPCVHDGVCSASETDYMCQCARQNCEQGMLTVFAMLASSN